MFLCSLYMAVVKFAGLSNSSTIPQSISAELTTVNTPDLMEKILAFALVSVSGQRLHLIEDSRS